TVVFIFTPLEGSWWLLHVMTTEGPTMLLSLAFCGLAIQTERLGVSRPFLPFAAGLVGGAGCLVKDQTRFALVSVIALLLISRRHAWSVRLQIVGAIALASTALLAPLYLRTSIKLGEPYLGTPTPSLRGVLGWTRAGLATGGHEVE